MDINIIDKLHNLFPTELKHDKNPPSRLYTIGNVTLLEETKSIGIIGTRNITPYGKSMIAHFVPKFLENGFTIVSGLTPGTGVEALRKAITLKGKFIIVLGYGINILKKDRLITQINNITKNGQGLIISPHNFYQKPSRYTYEYSNKIMVSIVRGILVIETALKSGTYTTIEYTLDMGKDVFCPPGSIFSKFSKGNHEMIKSGAFLVDNYNDISEVLN